MASHSIAGGKEFDDTARLPIIRKFGSSIKLIRISG